MERPASSNSVRRAVRVAIVILLVVVGVWSVSKHRKSPPDNAATAVHSFAGETMGTSYSVKVCVAAEDWAGIEGRIADAVARELDLVNARMSTWRDDSELSRFNQSDGAEPFPVSEETLAVFNVARAVSEVSNGEFDITVGPLVNAWGFGPDERSMEGPDDATLAALRQRVGFKLVEIDEANRTLRKARPDIYCDLSAVAKGYGVDRVAEALDALGISSYMVEVGGEVRTRGAKGDGPWRIGIERPVSEARALQEVLHMPPDGIALATSGDYHNFYMVDGVRLSHTIDPRTGRPIAHNLASASVLAPTCAEADAFATALMVLGPDEGYDLACTLDLKALLIVRDAPETFSERMTPAWEACGIMHAE
ncbi:MAG TPA: FAD:protein FMN transferase [Candidatus Hydrogenedentes bacterium]|nr:FAD:protein FMN transferase [Candidatus Hydrogenedentota bacterium]HOZ49311.1 FAD:protein FMN transferase [Candidatus Hydrogenedentota bacterium]HPG69664.1 FAD:protein FMN transferase [Candidatus Hydrogenedentota bacterium]